MLKVDGCFYLKSMFEYNLIKNTTKKPSTIKKRKLADEFA